jgi:hypothetical protein
MQKNGDDAQLAFEDCKVKCVWGYRSNEVLVSDGAMGALFS